MLIDLTEKNVGIGIEVGNAYAHSISVFTIAQPGSEIPTTLARLSTAVGFYRGLQDLKACFVQIGLLVEDPDSGERWP